MRRKPPGYSRAALVVALSISALFGCLFPADESGSYAVSMTTTPLLITVGDTVRLDAAVMRDGSPVEGVVVEYSSSDPDVAVVDSVGLMRAVSQGDVSITALVRRYENAEIAEREVRVLRGVEIDTVIPSLTDSAGGRWVVWGEPVTVVGRGLDPAALGLVFVDEYQAQIQSYVPAPISDTNALDSLRLWIPALPPETSTLLLARHNGSAAFWTLRVAQHDLLEPNDDALRAIALGTDATSYPGLALEVTSPGPANCWSVWGVTPGRCWSDGYVLDAPAGPQDITMIFKFPTLLQATPVAIEVHDNNSGPQGWLIAQNWSLCLDDRGAYPFFSPTDHPFTSLSDSFMIALKNVDASGIQFSLTLFAEATSATPAPTGVPRTTPYEMRIVPEYLSELPPDTAEENDFCHAAFPLAPPQQLQLTFDHGSDLDWFSFTVPGSAADTSAGVDVDESEPNDAFPQADTVTLSDRAVGVIDPIGDVDAWVFYADSGTALNLEVRAERDGESALNSMLLLFYGGEVLAINDDISVTTRDSRVNTVAPADGWYTVQVRDAAGRGGEAFPYVLSIGTVDPQSVTFSATVSGGAGLDPVVQLWQDNRLTEGSINLELEGERTVRSVIPPGDYLLLVYDRNGKASPYNLYVDQQPVTGASPTQVPAIGRRP